MKDDITLFGLTRDRINQNIKGRKDLSDKYTDHIASFRDINSAILPLIVPVDEPIETEAYGRLYEIIDIILERYLTGINAMSEDEILGLLRVVSQGAFYDHASIQARLQRIRVLDKRHNIMPATIDFDNDRISFRV